MNDKPTLYFINTLVRSSSALQRITQLKLGLPEYNCSEPWIGKAIFKIATVEWTNKNKDDKTRQKLRQDVTIWRKTRKKQLTKALFV